MKIYDDWWQNTLKNLPESNIDNLLIFKDEPKFEHSSNFICPLINWSLIKITGIDSKNFLQGQLTTNMEDLEIGACTLSSHCDPKGRMNANFYLYRHKKDDFLLILPSNNLKIALETIKKYSIFSKVIISDESSTLAILGINFDIKDNFKSEEIYCLIKTPNQLNLTIIEKNKNYNFLTHLHTMLELKNDIVFRGEYFWLFELIKRGIPFVGKEDSNKYLPQMFNLDALGGLSFNKGCYTGQEVIARTKFLGKVKKRCLPFKTISTIKTSNINEKEKYYDILNLEDKNIGYIINYTFNPNETDTHIYGLMIIKSFEEIQNKKENLNIKLFGDKKMKISLQNLPYSI